MGTPKVYVGKISPQAPDEKVKALIAIFEGMEAKSAGGRKHERDGTHKSERSLADPVRGDGTASLTVRAHGNHPT